MNLPIDTIAFYLLLIDSLIANLMVWVSGSEWYIKHFRLFSRYFPLTKGWALFYLALILWVGSILSRSGTLGL